MADEHNRLRVLSNTELENALKRRVTDCPMCRSNEWLVRTDKFNLLPVADNPNGPMHLDSINEEDDALGHVMTTVPAICRVCGFVAQFFYWSLMQDTEQPHNGSG